jgi:hypothetical protein
MKNWKALARIIEHRLSLISLFAAMGLAGCGGSSSLSKPVTSTPPPTSNPVPSAISLSPSTGVSGAPAFGLTVNGNSFVSSSIVQWNGSNRTTSYVSATQLTAAITAADLAAAGSANVTVVNPAPGGGTSQVLTFTTSNAVSPQSPTIGSTFGVSTIPLNSSTSLTFTINNPNGSFALSGVGFSDALPAGLVIASPNGLNGSCGGGAITAAAGSASISLSNAAVASTASCTFSVNVTGMTAGIKNNISSALASSEGNGGAASASLTVVAPPSLAEVFGATTIPLNSSTSLTFTINNSNGTVALSGVGFTDSLPAGLVVSTPNGLTGSCGGGTITAAGGSSSIGLSGATLSAAASCNFTVNVTGATAAVENNTTSLVTSTQGGSGVAASASLTIAAPLSLAEVFGAATIPLNTSTSLKFSINNPNGTVTLSGVGFTDPLPAGLVVSTPSGLTGSCGLGTITAAGGSSSLSLSGAALAGAASCTFSVNVTGMTAGIKNNVSSAVTSSEGSGVAASASLVVVAPPSLAAGFGANTIPLNSSTSLAFTINNSNGAVALSGVGFTDPLPAGLVVSTPNGLSGSCGGGTITAAGGSASISLSGATLSAGASCNFSVNVTGATAAVENNTTSLVTSAQGGNGAPASDSITVVAPPAISEAFGAPSILVGGFTSLSFGITNPNTTTNGSLTEVGVIDTLPSGLVVSTPSGLTGSCGGGTITAQPGSSSVSVSGATLADNAPCTFTVNVVGTAAGTQVNTTNAVTSSNGGNGNTAAATLIVLAPALVSYFSNANTQGAPDGTLRITDPGTDAAGNFCADIFVFDPNQELSECCSCTTTPNNLLMLSLNKDLTGNPLTNKLLTTGTITIVPAATQAGVCPLPSTMTPEPSLQSWSTHIQSGNGFTVTETEDQRTGLSAENLTALQQQCAAIQSVGSGQGICANSSALASVCNN